ncbi:MAG TPA: aromatic acid/H+ symport family MFS transporter [Bryobacteraceae bacterium]|nr:aromatic acid/H+ symport family MFS transporter [Bryobacteraceae bacterium]
MFSNVYNHEDRAMIIDASAFIDSRKIGHFQILVAILCAIVMLFDGLNTQVIGYLGPVLAKDWNLPPSALGPIFSASLTGLMIGLLVIGPLSDKVGRKLAMVTSTVLFGCFTLLTAGAHGVPDLLFYRLMAGIGLGGALPNALALTGEYCPARRRATLVVIMFCGFSLGSILGGGLTATLVSRVGWRPVFLVCGALPLLLAPILIGVLPESLPAHAPATGLPVAQLFHSGRTLGTLLLWLVFFMNLMVFFFLQNWLPTVLTGSGLATETAVLISTLISVGGIGAGLSIGPMMDRFGPYPVLAVLYICGTILVASIGFVSTSLPAIIAVTVGAGFSVSGGQKSVNALAVIFYPTAVRSTGVGWALGVGRIGSIVGPLLGGWMIARGWSNINIFEFASLPLLCAAAVVIAMGLRYGSSQEGFLSDEKRPALA